jgi:hypothetical protein
VIEPKGSRGETAMATYDKGNGHVAGGDFLAYCLGWVASHLTALAKHGETVRRAAEDGGGGTPAEVWEEVNKHLTAARNEVSEAVVVLHLHRKAHPALAKGGRRRRRG